MDSIARVISDFFESIISWISYFLSYLQGIFYGIVKFLVYKLSVLFEYIVYPFVSLLESIFGILRLDDFVQIANSFLSNPSFSFFATYFLLDSYLYTVLTAYLLRFLIRRIPFIG